MGFMLFFSIYGEPSKYWGDLNTRRMHDSIYGLRRPAVPLSPTSLLVLVEGGGHTGEDLVSGLPVDHVECCGRLVEEIIRLCNHADELGGFIEDLVELLEPGRLKGVPILLGAPETVAIVLLFLALLVVDDRSRIGLRN